MRDEFLNKKLEERKKEGSFRTLATPDPRLADFSSNDYLGIAKNRLIEPLLSARGPHGSTGSRLLSGNYPLLGETEELIAAFHSSQAALIFNSGYDANTGVLSCLPQKDDVILYDRLSHASLRDGIRLSFAQGLSFSHNDVADLEKKLEKVNSAPQKFVVTESVFSMDGDVAPLSEISRLCEQYGASLIVDEAHATGITGPQGAGLVQELQLQDKCLARIHTFGKACGVHGAAVLGSERLKQYLLNFCRQLIYTTSLPPASVEAIRISYGLFPAMGVERNQLVELIGLFNTAAPALAVPERHTPIQVAVIPGNEAVSKAAESLRWAGFDVRPIRYPTVPKGEERLRIVLHSFNTADEVRRLIGVLAACTKPSRSKN